MNWKSLGFGLVLLFLGTPRCGAQSPFANPFRPGMAPVRTSPVSPYLNLLRTGNSPAFNYTTLVRPQLQFQQSVSGLQTQLNTVQQTVTSQFPPTQQRSELTPTGVRAGFQTHQRGGTGQGPGFQSHTRFFGTIGGSGLGRGTRRR